MSDLSNKKSSGFERFLSGIERAGNKIPDIALLFIFLALATIVISWILSMFNVSVVHPGTGATLYVVNLLSRDGLQRMWANAVTNYSGFPPFGMVMVAVIGAGAAEKSGLFAAMMKKMLTGVRPLFVTVTIVAVGILGNVAGDAAIIVLPPIAGAIYLSMGRNPIVGIVTAICSVLAGFSANLMLGMTDALAYGFTESAARMIDPSYAASPAINYYFLVVSFFLLTLTGTLVSEKILMPRFAHIDVSKYGQADDVTMTPEQNRGLRWAGISFLVTAALIVYMSVGSNPLLGDENGSILAPASPFMRGIIVTVTVLMLIPAYFYGTMSGQYKDKKTRTIFTDISNAFKDVSRYIMMVFFVSQFISYFNWSNLGAVIAIKGADGLQALNVTGIPLLVGIVLVTCVINIFMGSASAKWALLAPI